MHFLHRLLSTLILLSACAVAVVLVVQVWRLPPFEARHREVGRPASALEPSPPQPGIGALSRLSLFPRWSSQQSLFAVVIENHEDARPYQRGLDRALLVTEFFVEGLISRFVALFDAAHPPTNVGPVRSLRPYFVDAVSPWTSTILYAGGSPEALARVENDPAINALNGLWLEGTFVRDEDVPAPHDIFLTRQGMLRLLADAKHRTALWPPYTVGSAEPGPEASTIRINFFNPDHNVTFAFDALQRSYTRENGSLVSDARPRNVLILAMPIVSIGEFGRLTIDSVGSGPALLFRSGKVYEGRWEREEIEEPFAFVDGNGSPLIFAQGQTWMTVVEDVERVRWEE